jgi:hypothetical protein
MKDTLYFVVFISVIVALFAFAFSFSRDGDIDGKQVFTDSKCNNCHTVTSVEITSKKSDASDLSNAGTLGEANLLKSYLLKEAKINDQDHKLKFKGSGAELDALVNWLLTLKTEAEN